MEKIISSPIKKKVDVEKDIDHVQV